MTALRPTPPHRKSRGFGTQWNATRVLDAINVPKDAYCVLAVTMCDLYPRDEWNFVYGLARLTGRVGVFSFVRHTPDFEEGSEAWREATMLHSSMKTMLHEIGHMFGMKHCTWYNCLMRGSNGAMVEHQPNYLHLCPVCLHKLQWSLGCSIAGNYAELLDLFQPFEESSEAFKVDCDFLRKRLAALEDVPIPKATHERPMRQSSKNATRAPRRRSLPSKGTNATLENDALSYDTLGVANKSNRGPVIAARSAADLGRVGARPPRSNSSAATPRSFKGDFEVLRKDVKRLPPMYNDKQIGQTAKS
jgi:predicted Zn-dependent protease